MLALQPPPPTGIPLHRRVRKRRLTFPSRSLRLRDFPLQFLNRQPPKRPRIRIILLGRRLLLHHLHLRRWRRFSLRLASPRPPLILRFFLHPIAIPTLEIKQFRRF